MLTEYALTPHVFDDEHNSNNPQWLEQLRAFGNRLLPVDQEQTFNTVISNLYSGSWYESNFLQIINSLEERQKTLHSKLHALDLLKQMRPRIERHLIVRPAVKEDYPLKEEDWHAEAVLTNARTTLPIHRIVGSSKLKVENNGYRLDQINNNDRFWDRIADRQWLEAKVETQVNYIKKMCSFYSFIGIASPHLSCLGSGRDLNFAIALIKSALDREHGLGAVQRLDLHTQGPYTGESERNTFAQNVMRRLQQEFDNKASLINLYLWPSLLERHLMFGKATGGEKPNTVWAISATHFARPDSDGPNQDPATFTLLPTSLSSKVASRYYSPNPNRKPYSGSPFTLGILG
ncbi:MAG: hypothetical protein ABIG61_04335 [Planctomycetota bacterium]